MLSDYLTERLEKTGISLPEFRELCLRLLNYGVLCRDESQVEQQLYDHYLRVEELANEYLDVMGIQLFHDRRFSYLRVYPPGAQVPGMDEAETASASGGMRYRLRQDEVALLLILRQLYDKALREGQLDESGFVTESIESLGIAMRNSLGRSLPEKMTDRKRVFNRLRQLRLIEYNSDDDLETAEAGLKIHPMIIAFITDATLAAINEAFVGEVDGEAEAGDTQAVIDEAIDAEEATDETDEAQAVADTDSVEDGEGDNPESDDVS